ncbi:hypothetical protein DXG03_005336 [Asterophora parasitica]|uniref:Uncharacterized protein n=1 Tax=Asterophora parasitica TaxID=117018 RepID=A0A9P7K9Y6_9AGAR|nr:hypothetical protein DXG03_005336 [Asterophora parasitica]
MTAYYPSQAGTQYVQAGVQPQMVYSQSGYVQQPVAAVPQMQYASSGAYYGQPATVTNGNVLVVPTHGSHHSHSHHGHHSSQPTVITTGGVAPMVGMSGLNQRVLSQQPGYGGAYGGQYYKVSFGERIRRFFGLAPRGPFKYRNNKGMWGFLGYSRRQRYSDARTGAEVDRQGRPIYRV